MKLIGTLTNEQKTKLKKDYRKALNTAWEIFGNDAFRKRYKSDDPRKPINKALFDSLSVSFAKLPEEQCRRLIEKKELLRNKFIALHNREDKKFLRALTQGTALKVNVVQRFTDIKTIIEETLEGK